MGGSCIRDLLLKDGSKEPYLGEFPSQKINKQMVILESKGNLVILQLLGMGRGFSFINKSYSVYGSLCVDFGKVILAECYGEQYLWRRVVDLKYGF